MQGESLRLRLTQGDFSGLIVCCESKGMISQLPVKTSANVITEAAAVLVHVAILESTHVL